VSKTFNDLGIYTNNCVLLLSDIDIFILLIDQTSRNDCTWTYFFTISYMANPSQ